MESRVTPRGRNWTVKPEAQCTPMPAPHRATFEIVAGNGTSVGTVMILACPFSHRAISGGRISCVQESNVTEWIGGIPECKLFTYLEGFRLALLLSIIGTAIIMLMSIIFLTSWLLKCVRNDEKRHLERSRREENDRLWQQATDEQRESFYTYNDLNHNNNSNNIQNNRCQEQLQGYYQINCSTDPLTLHHSQPTLGYMPSYSPIIEQMC